MSFESSTMTYAHVITFPSVWLPDTTCIRLLVLGGDATWITDLGNQLLNYDSKTNWALYHVSNPVIDNNKDLQDWILIMSSQAHQIWCNVDSTHVLTWAALLPFARIIQITNAYEKLMLWGAMQVEMISDLVQELTQESQA